MPPRASSGRRSGGYGRVEGGHVHGDAVPRAEIAVADALKRGARMDQREVDVEEHRLGHVRALAVSSSCSRGRAESELAASRNSRPTQVNSGIGPQPRLPRSDSGPRPPQRGPRQWSPHEQPWQPLVVVERRGRIARLSAGRRQCHGWSREAAGSIQPGTRTSPRPRPVSVRAAQASHLFVDRVDRPRQFTGSTPARTSRGPSPTLGSNVL